MDTPQDVKAVETTNQHNQGYRTFFGSKFRDRKKSLPGNPIPGYEVYDWPEFKAFMDRLGYAEKLTPLPTEDITIEIPMDDIVRIYHVYQGRTED